MNPVNCEMFCAVELASGNSEHSEAELTSLTEKWSRYSFAYFLSLVSYFSVVSVFVFMIKIKHSLLLSSIEHSVL